MINLTRKERTESMEAVINDILHDPDFNCLSVGVERPKVPRVGEDGSTYWQEVGICRVVIEGAVTPDEIAVKFDGESESDDDNWLMKTEMTGEAPAPS